MAIRKLLALIIVLVAAGCAATPEDPNRPVQPACSQTTNCFYERNIRSFQALDDRTVVVLVGRDQCPYRVELDGFFCDVSMSSFIAFDDTDGRICSWDRAYVVGGPFIRENEYCRVRDVTPMTDDELLETYATHGLAPPLPARGSGELEVVEEPEATPQPVATEETGLPVEPTPSPVPVGPD
jgi:hypothetical protein